jgi:hypothetical protein
MFRTSKLCRLGAMALVLFLPGTALAGQKHPGYVRAMDDLRVARLLLQRTNEAQTLNGSQDEVSLTVAYLDAAMADIDKEIGVERKKKAHDFPRIDARMPWGDRLTTSLRFLEVAQQECSAEKDISGDSGFRARVLDQLDHAHTRLTVAVETKNFDYNARNMMTRND